MRWGVAGVNICQPMPSLIGSEGQISKRDKLETMRKSSEGMDSIQQAF